jgi:hypothetical protein
MAGDSPQATKASPRTQTQWPRPFQENVLILLLVMVKLLITGLMNRQVVSFIKIERRGEFYSLENPLHLLGMRPWVESQPVGGDPPRI